MSRSAENSVFALALVSAVASLSAGLRQAHAAIDAPATLSFEYVRNDVEVFDDIEAVPPGTMMNAEAYASSNASEMGPEGVLIWAAARTGGKTG